jgi:hypothetical protein
MKDDASFLAGRQTEECDIANCRRPASIIISREPPIVLCSWCAWERYRKEHGIGRSATIGCVHESTPLR